jgi:hypothetical protein
LVALDVLLDEVEDELEEEDELVELVPELDDSEDFELEEDESELLAVAPALLLLPDSDRLSVR